MFIYKYKHNNNNIMNNMEQNRDTNLQLGNDIKELLIFYVKTHYENYLKQNNLKKIDENKLETVIRNIYTENKEHSKQFVINSLKEVYKDKCPDVSIINLILIDIFEDEAIILYKLNEKIKNHQLTL